MDFEPIDAVFRLHVDHSPRRFTEDPFDRRRDHSMTMRVAKDHHASSDDRKADQVTCIDTTNTHRGALDAVVSDLSRGYAYHSADYIFYDVI